MQCVMAMIFPLCNCNVMYYITEMHVMPITFQLLLHYNKFLHNYGLFQDFTAGLSNKNNNKVLYF